MSDISGGKEYVMKNLITRLLTVVMVMYIYLSSGFTAYAERNIYIPEVLNGVFVYDDDNVIDEATENKLNSLLADLEHKTSIEFAVITVKTLGDESVDTYANKVFNTLGIGKAEENNGILLLMSIPDGSVRIEIGDGLTDLLTDDTCGYILDEYFIPRCSQENYSSATNLTVQAVISVIVEEYNITLNGLTFNENIATTIENNKTTQMNPTLKTLLWIIGICVVLIIIEIVYCFFSYDSFGNGIVGQILGAIFSDSSSGNSSGSRGYRRYSGYSGSSSRYRGSSNRSRGYSSSRGSSSSSGSSRSFGSSRGSSNRSSFGGGRSRGNGSSRKF